jgi:hypothetical protein
MLTPVKCKWFSNRGLVGVVMAERVTGEIVYLIGTGDGLNEGIDVNLITALGSIFPAEAGDVLFGRVPAVDEGPSSASRVSKLDSKGKTRTRAVKTPTVKKTSQKVKK